MAEGSYVPAFDSLWDSQKTARLAEELRLSSTEVAGAKFLKLMAWARDRVESGDLGTIEDRRLLADAMDLARYRGDEIYRALVVSGFISADAAGHVRGWSEGPGRIVDRRLAEREKKRRQRGGEARAAQGLRDEHGRFIEGRTVLSQGTNGNVPRDTVALSPGTSPGLLDVPTRPIPPNPHGKDEGRPETGWAHERAQLLVEQADGAWCVVLQQLLEDAQRESTVVSFVMYLERARLEERGQGYAVIVTNELNRAFVTSHWLTKLRELLGTDDVVIEVRTA